MRIKLKKYEGQKVSLTGTIKRLSLDNQFILLVNIKKEIEDICDHMWIPNSKYLKNQDFGIGDYLEFSGIVRYYFKSDGAFDYRVCKISQIKIKKTQIVERKEVA
jgi:hypothetical protein